jgi:Na+/proline symporter
MSTIDTHFNWGASYVVNDLMGRRGGEAAPRTQVRTARLAVVAFAVLAVAVATQIDRIEQAWRWVAALGAALGAPTLLRWFWWRVTAASEIAGALTGLAVAATTTVLGVAYERQLLWIAATSLAATLLAIAAGPVASAAHARRFAELVDPPGVWPGRPPRAVWRGLAVAAARTALVVGVVVAGLAVGHRILFGG